MFDFWCQQSLLFGICCPRVVISSVNAHVALCQHYTIGRRPFSQASGEPKNGRAKGKRGIGQREIEIEKTFLLGR